MKRRIVCLFLAAALAAAILPARSAAMDIPLEILPEGIHLPFNPPDGNGGNGDEPLGEPVETLTSEAGIAFIKEFEGFSPTPISDAGQWSIGYGTACDPADYPDGITEEKADELMREALAAHEESLSGYIERNNLTLTQTQFDALASMTYNLGASWINSNNRFWTYLSNGLANYTDNEIASAMGVWCHVGTQIHESLITRRIREAQLFLYGDYEGTSCPQFCYLIFDGNGGTIETDVMLYVKGGQYQTLVGAERENDVLTGWYTADGRMLRPGDTAEENLRVSARWSSDPVAEPAAPQVRFSDVKEGEWFAGYINDLYEAGVIRGYRDGTFRPQAPVTAGEALKLTLLAAGFPKQSATAEHWAGGYRALALEQGFLDEADLAAGLDAPASRAMIAKLAARALGLQRGELLSPFADCEDDNAVALYDADIIDGSIDSQTGERKFYPDRSITRAEISKITWMLYRTVWDG